MAVTLLVLTLFNGAFETASNGHTLVKAVRSFHHHVTRPMYRHTVKPVEKELTKK